MQAPDVVIVGAGTAGCVLASRLAAGGAQVLVVEHGIARDPFPIGVLPLVPGSPWLRQFRVQLGNPNFYPESVDVVRGRVLGGSSAINGGYYRLASPADLEHWPAPWTVELLTWGSRRAQEVLGVLGGSVQEHSAASVGYQGGFALRQVPVAERWGLRFGPGQAYPLPDAVLLPGQEVASITMAGSRATGVSLMDGTAIPAGEVIICAGTFGSAELLLRAGIGSALPIGCELNEHPEALLVATHSQPRGHKNTPLLSAVTDLEMDGAQIEVRHYRRPFHEAIEGLEPGHLNVGVALMNPFSRGHLHLVKDQLVIDLAMLTDRRDVDALTAGIAAVRLAGVAHPDCDVVFSTSQHCSSSAPMGSVVDSWGQVLGMQGLAVVDGSILPRLPSRGPYATIVAMAEVVAAHRLHQLPRPVELFPRQSSH